MHGNDELNDMLVHKLVCKMMAFGALDEAGLDAFCCSHTEVCGTGGNVCLRVVLREWEGACCYYDTDEKFQHGLRPSIACGGRQVMR